MIFFVVLKAEKQMKILSSRRALLRRFQISDLGPLKLMMMDPEIMKFTGFLSPQKPERINELLKKWMTDDIKPLGVWAAEEILSKQFIGWFMLKETNSKDPELGFMISKKFWNQGYATEISSSILEYAFSVLGKQKVIASTNTDNHASIAVLKKLGMNESSSRDAQCEENILYYEKNTWID